MLKLLIILYTIIHTLLAKELKMVTILARHGARYPEIADVDEKHKGQITNNGLRMCYLLGRYVRQHYDGFFPKAFNFNENYVLASGINRTQQSAQAFMLGLYDFGSLNDKLDVDPQFYTPEWKDFDIKVDFETPLPLGFQPVPVHSFNKDENYVFESFSPSLCPKLSKFIAPTDSRSNEVLEFSNNILIDLGKQGFDYKRILGKDKFDNISEYYRLSDYIDASRYLGKKELTDELYDKIDILDGIQVYYAFYRDSQRSRYMFTEIGRLIQSGINATVDSIKAGQTTYRKFNLLYGHDMNLFNMYVILGLTNYECLKAIYQGQKVETTCLTMPPYASSVFWELYQDGDQFLIDFVINGEKFGFCHKDVSKSCTIDEFNDKMNSITLTGEGTALRLQYCIDPPSNWNTFLTFIIVVDVFAIAGLGALIYKQKRKLEIFN